MFHFVDYSRAYFEQVEHGSVPELREGKFVQVAKGDDEYVIFAPKELCKYHSHIVERFALDNNLAHSTNAKGDNIKIDDSEWSILGGGKMRIDDSNKAVNFGGVSQAYGPCVETGMARKLSQLAELSGYTFNILG